MNNESKLLKWVYCLSVGLFLYLPTIGQAEVITIEEFFNAAMPLKTVTKVYSHEMRDEFSTARYCGKYLAITNKYNITVNTPDGLKKTSKSSEIDIYSATERKSKMANIAEAGVIIGFLENKNRFISYYKEDRDKPLELGIFNINGTLLNTIPYLNGPTYISPGGEIFYVSGGDYLDGPISIYNTNGDFIFRIMNSSDYLFEAPTDTTLIVLEGNFLSLWNINTQQKVWENTIPGKYFSTQLSSYKITYSLKGNIIVVRDDRGVYSFDFQGNFLWSFADSPKRKRIYLVGTCKENGTVVVENAIVRLFNRDGELLNESEISFYGLSNWGTIADVFPNYILLRYVIRTDPHKGFATGIIYNNGQEWISCIVGGLWYLLHSENGTESLVGFDNESNVVSAFNIE